MVLKVTLFAYSQSHDFYSLKIPLPITDPLAKNLVMFGVNIGATGAGVVCQCPR